MWTGEIWRIEDIYGRKTIAKSSVDGLFLQLIANEILVLKQEKSGLVWYLGCTVDPMNSRETNLNYNYCIKLEWNKFVIVISLFIIIIEYQ